LQRISEEAIEQNGVLSQEDISKYLSCSVRTVKRDSAQIKQRGITVITRGALHNIGRGQTHKAKIVGLYLEGLTYSELKLRTHHSVGAIKRYLESFTKVAMAERHGIRQVEEISAVTGLSKNIIKQYQALLQESKKDPTKKKNLKELIERNGYREEVKKSRKTSGKRAVRMTGGSL
jgi:DNA-binding Lrp family transcriptional regulator